MSSKMYWVHVQGLENTQVFKKEDQFQSNPNWYRALRDARGNNNVFVTCLCCKRDTVTTKRRLKVSYSAKTDKYWLSAWPHTGSEHNQDCRYYSAWTNAVLAKGYNSDVLTTHSDNSVSIKLKVSLDTKTVTKSDDMKVSKTVTRAGNSKTSISLLGLIHYMWEKAQINVWRPAFDKKRSPGWLASRLGKQATAIKVGKTKLSDVLLLNASSTGEQQDRNKERVNKARDNKQRLVIISLLPKNYKKAMTQVEEGILGLSSPYGFPTLEISKDVFNQTQRRFARELVHWKNGKNTVAVIQTETPVNYDLTVKGMNVPARKAEVISMQLMAVSERFIPIDSSYEERLEEKLYEESRSFIKPLRYDLSEGVLPDFILTDTNEGYSPLEVFGMSHDQYLERKEEKIQFYNEQYGEVGWWSWDATKQDTIPDLPLKVISQV
ncbi:DUF1173 family protein [Providencia rettgeri]|uniref:DUF1173 family protein n=1 Tax=Providencia rettgeri TaxID=587 RepID=UPI0019D4DDAB|nr:DUF1173 family protein [Providencia rettgeri]MBN7843625.1 DUF1173 family protein [Providencia rettgeri]MBN7855313.1 DUF1173 family protein [Providencia rettgeri]MBN7863275.1 DUF1173 family protein [Providencia rettgeri]MBN7872547.1 DUF1173 family protein [Providencia rettgeri]MBN7897548.1 DUF1173 family protein [Providencia rettgeri]